MKKTRTLNQLTDKYVGKEGTKEREEFEFELTLDIIGDMIKMVRKERMLTQEELGKLTGVQKAQISKLENNASNVTIGTLLKIFNALRTKMKIRIELDLTKMEDAA